MALEHANAPLHTSEKIVAFWIVSIIVALTGIAVWNFQHLDACARMATLVSHFQIDHPNRRYSEIKKFTTTFLLGNTHQLFRRVLSAFRVPKQLFLSKRGLQPRDRAM